MSTVVGSIIAKLMLNIDNFAANMKNAEKQLSDIEDKFSGFSNIGSRFTDVGKALTLGVTTPIVGLGAAIVKTTSDFDTSMSNVKAISGATGEDFERLKEKAKEMGATTQFSASEAADAMGYMAMAGWKTDQIVDGLAGVMDLAAASGEDLASVSDILTDAMTAFGLQANESGKFADVLAAASSNANTNVSLLGESFKYVAPVAGALGYSAEDTAIALGLMANAGIKGSQGGTALRSALTRLVKPTGDMAEIMQEYGMSITNSDGSMKTLAEVMDMLRGKLGGLDEATQAQIANTLFGQEAMSGMLAIINASEGDYNKLTDAINNADGTAAQMAETMNDNLGGKIKKLQSALEGVAIQLGEVLVPIITGVVEWINKWVEKFAGLDENTQKIILVVAGLAAAIGPTLIGIGNMITAVGKISEAYDKAKLMISAFKDMQALATLKTKLLAGAQAALNLVMSMNPITLVIAGIVALVAIFVVLWNKCEGFREFWIQLWEGMKQACDALWTWLKDAANACIDWLVSGWDSIKEWWSGFWEWCKNAPKALWDWMTNLFNNVWESMKAGWEAFKEGFQNLWQGIKDWFASLWESIKNVFSDALGWVTDTFGSTFSGITQIWEGIKQYFSGAWEVIKNIFGGALLFLIDLVTLDFGQMKSDMINVWNNIKDGLSQMWDGIKNIFEGWLTAIKEFWSTSWELIKNKCVEIWQSIWSFITDTLTNMKNKLNEWIEEFKAWWSESWNNALNTIKETWSNILNSIKECLNNIGNKISESWNWFLTTIVNIGNNIKNWIVNTWNGIIDWFKQLPSRLRQIGSDMFTSLKNGISSTISGIYSAVTNGMNSAINFLKDLPRQAITWGKHMIEGFIQGIKNTVGKLVDSVKNVGQNIRDFLGFTVPKKGPLHVYMEWMPHMMEGMRDSLRANQHKLINAAKGVAGELNDAINSDLALATDSITVNANGTISHTNNGVSSGDKDTNLIRELITEVKKLSDKSTQYNINIDKVDANNPEDVRRLAEELQFFKDKDFRY